MKSKYALISVFEKKNIKEICQVLTKFNIKIISTESTTKHIQKIGFKANPIEKYTKFKQILDGRVKTLHPSIHASILFNRQNKKHVLEFNKLNFPLIDFLVVNLYPFKKIMNTNKNKNHIIEMIDIGGLTMLRSGSKNFNSVTTICDINDYSDFKNNLIKNNGKTDLKFRKKMASKVFNTTSNYDLNISNWLDKKKHSNIKITNHNKVNLRYGENPHQKAFLYKKIQNKKNIYESIVKTGKELSYNNIVDIDNAFNSISEFKAPTCIIIKHNNPCGVATNNNLITAYINALKTDLESSFGGIVAVNRRIGEKIAKKMISNFYEIILAPKFSNKALMIFKKRKNLILLETKNILPNTNSEIKSINNGYLIQEKNKVIFKKQDMLCVSRKKASKKLIDDMIFGFKISKYLNSNSIVLVKNKKTISIAGGQTSRINATRIALSKLSNNSKKNGFIVASDAFFPFEDNIKLLINNNCKAIIQPKGSLNDQKIIKFANKNNLPLYFSKYRFFKH